MAFTRDVGNGTPIGVLEQPPEKQAEAMHMEASTLVGKELVLCPIIRS